MALRPRRVVDEQLVFALGPLSEESGWIENIFESAIKPAASAMGMRAEHARMSHRLGEAMRDVWHNIWRAKLVVADITTDNPNVNYELGICHCIGVPVILIARSSRKDFPFDYRHLHVESFDSAGVLRSNLRKIFKAIQTDTSANQPIWSWPDTAFPRGALRHGNDHAYREDLSACIESKQDRLQKAVLIQYSAKNAIVPLRQLWEQTRAEIELYVVSKKYALNKQKKRVDEFLREIAHELETYNPHATEGSLKIFRYDTPGSLRCILLQDEIVSLGSYLYEWKKRDDERKRLDVRGGEVPTFVIRRTDPDFGAAQAMVLDLLKNWHDEKLVECIGEFSRDKAIWKPPQKSKASSKSSGAASS